MTDNEAKMLAKVATALREIRDGVPIEYIDMYARIETIDAILSRYGYEDLVRQSINDAGYNTQNIKYHLDHGH